MAGQFLQAYLLSFYVFNFGFHVIMFIYGFPMQEAFRSVEDIHGLMSLVKKSPKTQLMVVYYAKLTDIFWVSDSHLYHAYAWFRLFTLQKSYNKNLSQKDLQLIASSVLLAALSVAPYDQKHGASHLELENDKERNLRMASLINFTLDHKGESREMVCIFVNCFRYHASDHCTHMHFVRANILLLFVQLSRSSLLVELVRPKNDLIVIYLVLKFFILLINYSCNPAMVLIIL